MSWRVKSQNHNHRCLYIIYHISTKDSSEPGLKPFFSHGITSLLPPKGNSEGQWTFNRGKKCNSRLTQLLSNERVLEEEAEFLNIRFVRSCL
jgi:hypothetical protein